jgi:hypothetical protein
LSDRGEGWDIDDLFEEAVAENLGSGTRYVMARAMLPIMAKDMIIDEYAHIFQCQAPVSDTRRTPAVRLLGVRTYDDAMAAARRIAWFRKN